MPLHRSPKHLCLAVSFGLTIASLPGHASDSPFGYVYTTDTHPKGQWEVEQWITNRHGKLRGDYDAWLYRTELEYGISNEFQASLYANYNSVNAFRSKADGATGGTFVPDDADPDARYQKRFFDSASAELIYRLLSPYKDPIGLAIYIEPTYGPKHRELEAKLILQKNFLEDQLVWAANLTAALEREKFPGEWEKETELEFTTGLAYRFAPNWHAGGEFRHLRKYEGYGFGTRETAANFVGPAVHYDSKSWWASLTYLPQIGGAKAYTEEAREELVNGRIYGETAERREIRLKVGITF